MFPIFGFLVPPSTDEQLRQSDRGLNARLLRIESLLKLEPLTSDEINNLLGKARRNEPN